MTLWTGVSRLGDPRVEPLILTEALILGEEAVGYREESQPVATLRNSGCARHLNSFIRRSGICPGRDEYLFLPPYSHFDSPTSAGVTDRNYANRFAPTRVQVDVDDKT